MVGKGRVLLLVVAAAVAVASFAFAAYLVIAAPTGVTPGARAALAPTPPAGKPSRRVGAAFERLKGDELGDSVRAALKRAVLEQGGRLTEEAPPPATATVGLDLRILSSRLGGRDDEQLLRLLAEQGCDLVIATGARFAPTLARIARDYPGVRFAVIGALRDFRDSSPNTAYIAFDDAQAAFLAGAVAARMEAREPKAKLGFVGALDGPEARACQAGFHAGAAYARPAFRKSGAFLTGYCAQIEGSAYDPSAVESLATSQYRKGAGIVFEAAGGEGKGVVAAARKAGKLAMSGPYSPERASPAELAAAITRNGGLASAMLLDELFSTGSLRAGTRLVGLRENLVGCVLADSAKDGPTSLAPGLEELRALIVSGSLRVPYDQGSEAEFIKSLD